MNSSEIGTMYHLVGEQPLPVFLGARQFPATRHVLWYTEQTEKTSANLLQVMHKHQLRVERQLLNNNQAAYDMTYLRKVFAEVFARHAANGERVGLNATGGTKLMSLIGLSALEACLPADRRMACYVDTGNRKLIPLSGDWNAMELDTPLTIDDFVGLAGAKILKLGSGPDSDELLGRQELVQTLWKYRAILQRYQADFAALTHSTLANQRLPPERFTALMAEAGERCPPVKEVQQHPSFKNDWQIMARFLAGAWFEEYCLWQILAAPGGHAIKEIRLGLEPAVPPSQTAFQEFDVCYTDGMQFFILECKAGKLMQDHVQKLENICRHFSGSLGRAALVSLNDISTYRYVAERFLNSNNLACFSGADGIASLCANIWNIKPGQFNRSKEMPSPASRTRRG